MFSNLSNFFQKSGIELYAPIPLRACELKKPYLLEREGITDTGSAVLFAVPYRTPACDTPRRNLSAYAVSRDYHAYFSALFDEILPVLRQKFPNEKFVGFADHAPINEVDAAARAGLGILGKNGLLLTEKHSSFVFLGGIYTTLSLPATVKDPKRCEDCGACARACPAKDGAVCLSSLTQKKGELTKEEGSLILANGSVWGCDICQDVCPHTRRAKKDGTLYTKIPYFYDHPITHLCAASLAQMSDEEFSHRAYAWRGKETILRNLQLAEKGDPLC